MALSNTEKAQVRRYLAHPDINRQYDLRLEGAMDSLSAEGEVHVQALLVSLDSIQTSLAALYGKAHVFKVEDVRLDIGEAIRTLRAEGNRLARELGEALDRVPARPAFSGQSNAGVMRHG